MVAGLPVFEAGKSKISANRKQEIKTGDGEKQNVTTPFLIGQRASHHLKNK
jgi:hypothetical protein